MIDKKDLVAIRSYMPSDYNFIMATWLRGLYYGDSWFSLIPKDEFMKNYHTVLEVLLTKPTTKVKIACLKNDPEVILGYSVSNQDESTVHWAFVKRAWRSIGISKMLVSAPVTDVTHLTKLGLVLLKAKLPHVHFNPFKT